MDISSVWNVATKVGNVVTATGFGAYLVTKLRKKYQKPELAASISVTSRVQARYLVNSEYINTLIIETRNGILEIEQTCKLTITNNTEHIALKLRLIKGDNVELLPEIDYTKPIMPHQTVEHDITIKTTIKGDGETADIYRKKEAYPFDEIMIEYQNGAGKKFLMLFHPNETDVTKRSKCVKA